MALAIGLFAASCDEEDDPIDTGTEQDADIVAFTFDGIDGTATIDKSAQTVTAKAAETVELTAIVADFTLSKGATAKVGSVAQESKTTANNFSSPVVYKVTSGDGETVNDWTVTVTGGKPVENGNIMGDATDPFKPLPKNLKVSFTTGAGYANAVTKIGNEFHCTVSHDLDFMPLIGEYYLKYNAAQKNWTSYEKKPASNWTLRNPSTLVANGFVGNTCVYNLLMTGRYLDFILDERKMLLEYERDGGTFDVKGSDVIAGRAVTIIELATLKFYMDDEYFVCLKSGAVSGVVTLWDETVTGFGGIDLPQ
jgi:hypothetical protein